MKGYTDIQAIEDYLLIEIESDFQGRVEIWIEQIERFIDRMTGRNFVADSTASERIYDGDGSGKLLIDDCVEVSKVTVDDAELDESGLEYYVYPANDTPKRTIESDYAIFTEGRQNVKIEAKWGFSVAVPEDIAFAATVLVAGMIQNSDDDGIQSESIGRYSVTYKSQTQVDDFDRAKKILESYKKYIF